MGQQGNLTSLVFPLAMFAAIFYFMIIRPQKKKQKLHDLMLSSITTGDEIITAGGFFGVVDKILDDSYIIVMDKNLGSKTRILKSSVLMKKPEETNVAPKPKKKKKVKKVETDNSAVKAVDTSVKEEIKEVADISDSAKA